METCCDVSTVIATGQLLHITWGLLDSAVRTVDAAHEELVERALALVRRAGEALQLTLTQIVSHSSNQAQGRRTHSGQHPPRQDRLAHSMPDTATTLTHRAPEGVP